MIEVKPEKLSKQVFPKELTDAGIVMEVISDNLATDLTSASGIFPQYIIVILISTPCDFCGSTISGCFNCRCPFSVSGLVIHS